MQTLSLMQPTRCLLHQNLQFCYGITSPHLLSPFHPLRCCCPRSLLRLLLAQSAPSSHSPLAPMQSLPWQGRAAMRPPGHHPMTFLTRSWSTTVWLTVFPKALPGSGDSLRSTSVVALAGRDLDSLNFLKQPMPGLCDAVGRVRVPGHGKYYTSMCQIYQNSIK